MQPEPSCFIFIISWFCFCLYWARSLPQTSLSSPQSFSPLAFTCFGLQFTVMIIPISVFSVFLLLPVLFSSFFFLLTLSASLSSSSFAASLSLVDQTVEAAKLPEARTDRGAALSDLPPSPERQTNADTPISCKEIIIHHLYQPDIFSR